MYPNPATTPIVDKTDAPKITYAALCKHKPPRAPIPSTPALGYPHNIPNAILISNLHTCSRCSASSKDFWDISASHASQNMSEPQSARHNRLYRLYSSDLSRLTAKYLRHQCAFSLFSEYVPLNSLISHTGNKKVRSAL